VAEETSLRLSYCSVGILQAYCNVCLSYGLIEFVRTVVRILLLSVCV